VIPACPICGATDWTEPAAATRLCFCRGCRTVFNDRSASRAEEERRYDVYSRQSGVTRSEAEGREVALHQWNWVRSVKQPSAGQPAGEAEGREPGTAVLDVGCGHGSFLRAAREDGCRVAGIELDPAGAATCRALEIPVTQGSLFDVEIPAGPWDVITLWDVLEHLECPARALRLLAPLLAPGGLLIVRGRNARLHAPLKIAYSRVRVAARALRVPDLSCVHRWGFGTEHYRRLLHSAGLPEVALYPGVPTPGDRSRMLGPRAVAAAVKRSVGAFASSAHQLSGGRWYPFPSVLVAGGR
jgi:2-polyprenyl-3-methyl-5-hydroxy-6-metoxy-1,4-benzoquinol methylase